jgi:hypothetical protein
LRECEEGAACVVEFGAPVGGAGLVGLGGKGGGVEAVLLTAQTQNWRDLLVNPALI